MMHERLRGAWAAVLCSTACGSGVATAGAADASTTAVTTSDDADGHGKADELTTTTTGGEHEGGSSSGGSEAECAPEIAGNPAVLLVDPENCGACNHSCLGGACISGLCQATILGQYRNGGTLYDGAFYQVVYGTQGPWSLTRWELETGNSTKLATIPFPEIEEDLSWPEWYAHRGTDLRDVGETGILVTAGASAFEYETSDYLGGAGWLLRLPHDGGEMQKVADGVGHAVFGPDRIYFAPFSGPTPYAPNPIVSVPLGGGPTTPFGAVDGHVSALMVRDGYVYAETTFEDHHAIVRAPESTGVFETVTGDSDGAIVRLLSVDDGVVTYLRLGGGLRLIRRDLEAGEDAMHIIPPPQVGDVVRHGVVDQHNLYFLDNKQHAVVALSLATGEQRNLQQFMGFDLRSLAQDDEALYFFAGGESGGGAGDLLRLAKPAK